MSHYCVAVFHTPDQDVNDLLAPYSEHIQIAPHKIYTREEAIQSAKQYKCNADVTDDNKLWQFIANEYTEEIKHADGTVVKLPRHDWAGNIYSTYNENAKWDYYTIEGAYTHFIEMHVMYKRGYKQDIAEFDAVRVKHIDFRDNKEDYDAALKFWDDYVDGQNPDATDWYKPEYYKEAYGDRETYAKCVAGFHTYAVITPGGMWFEPGPCGWFGMSLAKPEDQRDWELHYKERFIDTADPDWLVTFVDCHI